MGSPLVAVAEDLRRKCPGDRLPGSIDASKAPPEPLENCLALHGGGPPESPVTRGIPARSAFAPLQRTQTNTEPDGAIVRRQNLQERGFAGGKRQFIVRSSQKGRSRERLFCCPKSIPPGLTFRSLASIYVHCLLCTVRCILSPQTSSPLACEFNLRVRTASSLPIKMLRGALRMNAVLPCRFLVLPLVLIVSALAVHAAPVLMISIDGLKPEYITQADAHGMKIPYLRTLLANGTYADGVVGIWPTVTYPSHTTLITGVWPAEHGIYNNHEFDPFQRYFEAWNWYASADSRSHALAGCAPRRFAHGEHRLAGERRRDGCRLPDPRVLARPRCIELRTNPDDQLLMAALSRPDTLIQQLKPAAGPYMNGNDTSIAGDEAKTRYTLEILRRFKPAFMTLHLSSLDDTQHAAWALQPGGLRRSRSARRHGGASSAPVVRQQPQRRAGHRLRPWV